MGSSSWIRKLFPGFGAFLFWILWPWIVVKTTAKMYRKYTGDELPKDQAIQLRKDLAKIRPDKK
jgi:hypothetical protein